MLQQQQKDLLDLLLSHQALKFGSFTTKSGRESPYFFNLGAVATGRGWSDLCRLYANHLIPSLPRSGRVLLYGPAYKGIPLCVGIATALATEHGINAEFVFNRKEAKDHGEGGNLIGARLARGEKVIVVEDVLTAGSSIAETVGILNPLGVGLHSIHYVIDRTEKSTSGKGAKAFLREQYQASVSALISIRDIVGYLRQHPSSDTKIDDALFGKISAYWQIFGAV